MADRVVDVRRVLGDEELPAGRLWSHRRRGRESATFAYDAGYLAHPRAYALEPGLPLVAGQQQTAGEPRDVRGVLGLRPRPLGSTADPARRGTPREARGDGRAELRRDRLPARRPRRPAPGRAALRRPGHRGVPVARRPGDPAPARARRSCWRRPTGSSATRRQGASWSCCCTAAARSAARGPRHTCSTTTGASRSRSSPARRPTTGTSCAGSPSRCDWRAGPGFPVPDSQLHVIDGKPVLIVDRFDRAGDQRIGYASAMTHARSRRRRPRQLPRHRRGDRDRVAARRRGSARVLAPDRVLGPDPQHRRPSAQPRLSARDDRGMDALTRVRPQSRPAARASCFAPPSTTARARRASTRCWRSPSSSASAKRRQRAS